MFLHFVYGLSQPYAYSGKLYQNYRFMFQKYNAKFEIFQLYKRQRE